MGTSHRQAPVKQLVGAVRAGLADLFGLPDGLGDRARQRRHDGVLGRRHVRARRAAQRAPRVRRVLVEVRRGVRRRAAPRRPGRRQQPTPATTPTPSPTPTVDVYALTHNETSTGVAMDLRRPAGARRRARRRRRHVGRRRPAVGPGRGRRLLLRPAEVLRRRRRAVGRGLLAGRRRAHRAHRRRPTAGGRRRSTSASPSTNSRQDQTYNTPAVATLILLDAQLALDARLRRPRLVRQAQPHVVRPPLRLGRGTGRGRRRSSPTRPSARPSSARSTSTTRIDADQGQRRAAGQRHRRHRQLPQARPQPAAHRHVPGHRPGRRRGAHGVHRPPRRAPRRSRCGRDR